MRQRATSTVDTHSQAHPPCTHPGPAGRTDVSVETRFFGPGEQISGELYWTTGSAAEFAVLLCPPAGHERSRCLPMIDATCRQLASLGGMVLHVDYAATDKSADYQLSLRLVDWLESIRIASDWLSEVSQLGKLDAIGMRLGAPLLLAAELTNIQRKTLWDPVFCGGDHLRAHRRLHESAVARPWWSLSRPVTAAADQYRSQYHEWMLRDLNHIILATHAFTLGQSDQLLRMASEVSVEDYLSPLQHHSLSSGQVTMLDENPGWKMPTCLNKPLTLPLSQQAMCEPYLYPNQLRHAA